jgi:hypothetical protein
MRTLLDVNDSSFFWFCQVGFLKVICLYLENGKNALKVPKKRRAR